MSSQTPLSEMKGLSQPAQRALSSAGFTYAEELVGVSEPKLKKLHGMGPKALRILGEFLESRGLEFKKV